MVASILFLMVIVELVFILVLVNRCNAQLNLQATALETVKQDLTRQLLVHELTIDAHDWKEIPPHKVIHVAEVEDSTKGGA